MKGKSNKWLKKRGYLHLTNQLDASYNNARIISLVKNVEFISNYSFYPLIHSTIKERRFKQNPVKAKGNRSHSYKTDDGFFKSNAKKRPLHYATHLDAAIYGYYSEIILAKYEDYLRNYPKLQSAITAYRKIPKEVGDKNKSTIDFANDAFTEIKRRAKTEECVALLFDVKSFFNEIDHEILKQQWIDILGEKFHLPPDHYNVFRGITKFSYILKDDFRLDKKSFGRRLGFDEKKLSQLRKKRIHAFFESPADFRNAIKMGEIKIHVQPFRKNGKPCGFPQGLPISSTLANLYMLKFDEGILKNVVEKYNGFYRRYSDDIIILIDKNNAAEVENYIHTSIEKYKLEISKEKTERYIFRKYKFGNGERLVSSSLSLDGIERYNIPLTYLGFEFYGFKTLIKSANLAKFYRRLISSVKTKTIRAHKSIRNDPSQPYTIYRNQLFRLYMRHPLSAGTIRKKIKTWDINNVGDYYVTSENKKLKHSSNYLSYINRASVLMEEPAILKQINSHKKILHCALNKHKKKVFKSD